MDPRQPFPTREDRETDDPAPESGREAYALLRELFFIDGLVDGLGESFLVGGNKRGHDYASDSC